MRKKHELRITFHASLLIQSERQDRAVARPLDRGRKHALMRRACAGYSPGQYLAALGDVAPEKPPVFVIYVIHLVGAKAARLARAYETPPAALSAALAPASVVAAPVVSLFAAHRSPSSSSSSSLPIGRTGSAVRRPRREPALAAA